MSLTLCLPQQSRVLEAPGCAASSLDTTWTARGLSATTNTSAAKVPQPTGSSFHNLNVIRALPHDGKSIAMFSYPDLQDVSYAGKLISNRFVRARLVLCYPKQLIEQSWDNILIPQQPPSIRLGPRVNTVWSVRRPGGVSKTSSFSSVITRPLPTGLQHAPSRADSYHSSSSIPGANIQAVSPEKQRVQVPMSASK
jgi:hypothetical protein